MTRPSGRSADQLRTVELITNVSKHAEGSCLVKFGDTQVLCLAFVLKGQDLHGMFVGPHREAIACRYRA